MTKSYPRQRLLRNAHSIFIMLQPYIGTSTLGIVLCRDADKTYVEYLLQDYTQPMGVATYKVMPENLRRILPPEEEFKKLLDK